jgi:hypothetical protein
MSGATAGTGGAMAGVTRLTAGIGCAGTLTAGDGAGDSARSSTHCTGTGIDRSTGAGRRDGRWARRHSAANMRGSSRASCAQSASTTAAAAAGSSNRSRASLSCAFIVPPLVQF